jgi:hypothetical protein
MGWHQPAVNFCRDYAPPVGEVQSLFLSFIGHKTTKMTEKNHFELKILPSLEEFYTLTPRTRYR